MDLRCANLSGATFSGAIGLAAERLGGANLTDVELPPSLSDFDMLRVAEELSKSLRTLLIALLMVCVYCWLTIGTTLDVKLFANSVRSSLPIIQTEVPISSFYWIVPRGAAGRINVHPSALAEVLADACRVAGGLPERNAPGRPGLPVAAEWHRRAKASQPDATRSRASARWRPRWRSSSHGGSSR